MSRHIPLPLVCILVTVGLLGFLSSELYPPIAFDFDLILVAVVK